jgi:hypothetical protein
MQIEETPEQLILRDRPGCIWGLGLFFLLIGGLFALGPWFFFTDRAETPFWQTLLASAMGWVGVSVALWLIARTPHTTVLFDRLARTINIQRWGLAGRKIETYTFSEAAGFEVVQEKDTEGDPIFRLRLNLRSGQSTWLTMVHLHADDAYVEAATRARRYLGLADSQTN